MSSNRGPSSECLLLRVLTIYQITMRKVAALALAVAGEASSRPKPQFSWATVPVFQHLASVNATFSAPFPAARLAWLASSYPLVVLEHAQGQGAWAYTPPNGTGSTWGPAPFIPPSGAIEDHFVAAAAALKARTSSVVVLYYQQITGALPYYRASQVANAHPEMTLDGNCSPRGAAAAAGGAAAAPLGDILPNYVTWAWDHTKDGVTQNFVAAFQNLTSHSALDGTFIDTASCYNSAGQAAASLATVQAMQAAVPDRLVGFHTDSGLSGANGFSAAMDYTFAVPSSKKPKPGKKDLSCAAGISWLAANGGAGVMSLAHIGDVDQGPDYTYSLACFLAGANELS